MASSSNQSMGALQLPFPLLNRENYDFWSVKMKIQLMSNDVWEYVEDWFKDYQGVEVALSNEQKQQLKVDNRKNLKMKDSNLLNDYFSRLMDVVNQMKTYGEDVTTQKIVEKILINLPTKYDPIVAVIDNTQDLANLSVE
ncbi:hypothetical protein RHSIM_Rhsim10G0116500 [Rhododendron simsii]|uniref:DUF4219 domain-containing protein n=1 Tax=Rhododendron simsii TaxID=118357 RepID=A0A834LCP8_RHOSS|nr:hypothetical protein RHSIM_Rhsim10G0116500 [Rhododendron simsii]